MENNPNKHIKSAVCFGEILWDLFPDGKRIGGAPFNVAKQLLQYGMHTKLISAVGKDDHGYEIMEILKQNSIAIDSIQIKSSLPTGNVTVQLDSYGSASYTISKPVAWDAIEIKQKNEQLVADSDVFVYGSLAARSGVSNNTLFELLEYADFKVFDVNLRPPHFNFDLLQRLLLKADFIKFNDDELDLICSRFDLSAESIQSKMLLISNKFNAESVVVTLGSKGASLLHKDHFFQSKSYKVDVKDTVGAGDAFLAALISSLENNTEPQVALNFACAMGALVASKAGANPKILESEINQLLKN